MTSRRARWQLFNRLVGAWALLLLMNSAATAVHLQTILDAYPDPPILLLWDRAPWHRGAAVRQVLADNPRLEIVSFPTASPDLNPQEQVWKATRRAVSHTNTLEHYDGGIRVFDSTGNSVAQWIEPHRYQAYIGEAVEPWSYLKSPYYRLLGYPQGMYRVGPLARLNIVERCGTPRADAALDAFRAAYPRPALSSFLYHYARLIEIVWGIERIEMMLSSDDILNERVRAFAEPNRSEGIGVSEAPRGTLIHHYKIDEQGLVTWANLIIASGNNNLAMNRAVLQTARYFVQGANLTEGMLNRVEAVIRAFDPCLSCSTHALGQMPLCIELLAPDGQVLSEVQR